MSMFTFATSTAPELLRVVRSAYPSYRKKTIFASVADTVTLHGTFWDEGSRSTYTAVHLATMRASAAPQYAPPQFGGSRVAPTVPIPPGVAIVETGISCGKVATAHIYINPSDVAPMLPAAAKGAA